MSAVARCGAVVFVKQLERMAAFYGELAALTPMQQEDGHAVLESDRLQLVLQAIPPSIAARFEIADPPQMREEASIKLIFPVTDLAAARAAAAARGGRVLGPEQEWVWQDCRVCDGVDPEGNVFQLRAPVAAANARTP